MCSTGRVEAYIQWLERCNLKAADTWHGEVLGNQGPGAGVPAQKGEEGAHLSVVGSGPMWMPG